MCKIKQWKRRQIVWNFILVCPVPTKNVQQPKNEARKLNLAAVTTKVFYSSFFEKVIWKHISYEPNWKFKS